MIDEQEQVPPAFSTDIASAWMVVEKLASDGLQVLVEIMPSQTWPHEALPAEPGQLWSCATLLSGTDMLHRESRAATAPHAICLAALAALPSTGAETAE